MHETRFRPPASPPCLAEAEQAHVQTRWREQFDARWPAAEPLLARISPPNWALEWSLPGWLGDALGLPAPSVRGVTLGNVYGLAHVRLHDDLSDERLPAEDYAGAQALAVRLYQQWLAVYSGLFGDDALFWNHFGRYLDQWRRASLAGDRLPDRSFEHYDEAHFLTLGQRGAPLKACAAATCLLARREALLPQLEAILDQLMIGAVLLDHAADWAEDLAAARPNVFVAYASPSPQTVAHMPGNRSAVLRELTIGQGARPYFAIIDDRLGSAQSAAQDTKIHALADYIAWLRRHAVVYGRGLARAARRELRAITVALLDTPAV